MASWYNFPLVEADVSTDFAVSQGISVSGQ